MSTIQENQEHHYSPSEYEEDEYDENMLCAHCQEETPMFPRKNSKEDCNILCADCYWEEDSRQKHERRVYFAHHPEEYEAFRKQAAKTFGVAYVPLPKEWYAAILAEEEKQKDKDKDDKEVDEKTQSESK